MVMRNSLELISVGESVWNCYNICSTYYFGGILKFLVLTSSCRLSLWWVYPAHKSSYLSWLDSLTSSLNMWRSVTSPHSSFLEVKLGEVRLEIPKSKEFLNLWSRSSQWALWRLSPDTRPSPFESTSRNQSLECPHSVLSHVVLFLTTRMLGMHCLWNFCRLSCCKSLICKLSSC